MRNASQSKNLRIFLIENNLRKAAAVGTPTIKMLIAYLKMSKDEKHDVKKDFSAAPFIFTIVFLVTGYFLASLGNLLTLNMMKLVGIPLMIIAGIIIAVDKLKKNKVKSIFIPMLTLFLIVITMG